MRPRARRTVAGLAAAAAIAALAARAAHAEPEPAAHPPSLRVTHEPPPRHLRMRPRAAAVPPPPPSRPAIPMPAAPPRLSELDARDRDELAGLRDVLAPVSFSITVGYQVDGARPSGRPSLDAPLQAGRDYNALRAYGFGELFFSTRGVAVDSLSSYIALRLDATAPPDTFRTPGQPATRIAPPIATWFERSTFETRTGWAEVKDFLPRRLGLRKLRVRAGSQYIYGPWVLHLDGALVAYDGDIATATAYAGGRHADYTTDLTSERYVVAGGALRVDLRKLIGVPIAITGETLSLTSYVADQPDSAHRQLAIDWQPHRDLTVTGQLRTLDDRLASERLQLRARYHEVTNLVLEVVRRYDDDWRWDPSLIAPDDPTSARRYLDLGPVLPQVVASLRAGTLIAENVDLLLRGALAADLTPSDATRSSFSAAYAELGGAVEVRLRRAFALGISALTRRDSRADLPGGPIIDERLIAQPLPPSAATGERSFTEGGARARMSLGARRLSALLELYARRTRYTALYVDPTSPIPTSDVRGGGRVSVEAWIGPRLKLSAAYDATTAIDQRPEITLYKSLRLTMTGAY